MNKTYCALPFRETMLVPGNVLLLCCKHDTNVLIKNSFEESFKSGKIQEIRELMLAGKTVAGCEQCYKEEENGIESMREQSIKTYGVVNDIQLKALHVQFDNVCNLKCRMCASPQSHLLYNEEVEIFGKSISWQKLTVTDYHNEIDTSNLEEIRLHGGEPFLSKRAEGFFKRLIESGQIKNIRIITPTNGMIKPSGILLTAIESCKYLSVGVSIDAYGGLNDYFRSKSNFDTVISNLDFFYSLMDSRPANTTNILAVTTVNVYNVNKLKELDEFLKARYTNLELKKSFLNNPEYLRISSLPKEYKDKIQNSVEEYPDVIKMLNANDPNYFEEFVFYHKQLDSVRQESLMDFNLELTEFINNYTYQKNITKEDISKFYNFVEPEWFND